MNTARMFRAAGLVVVGALVLRQVDSAPIEIRIIVAFVVCASLFSIEYGLARWIDHAK